MEIKLETSDWKNYFKLEQDYNKVVREDTGIELGEMESNSGKEL